MKNSKTSVRAVAAEVILAVLDQGKSLSTVIPDLAKKILERDIPLLQEICFGVCRTLPRLEHIIKQLVSKPLKGKTRIIHTLLLVSLYQLLYLRTPSHAVVNEAVIACKILKSDNFKALVNGCLRRFLREQETLLAKFDQHWQTLHPEWLVNQLKKDYPEHWREIIEANNQKPPMWLRINKNYSSAKNYLKLLQEQGIEAYLSESTQAILLKSAVNVHSLPHFEQGWVTVQDYHAQWAAQLLEPNNDETILDACAAPGGKTTHILEFAPQARVVAVDIEADRLNKVRENLQRLQQQAEVICGDASKPDTWLQQGLLFDKILLDAPCSATGVIRRHPDIKWLRKATDIEQLAQLQNAILTALWQRLKIGGTLVYATCSVLKQENEDQIKAFLQAHQNAKLLSIFDSKKAGKQFFPHPDRGDGFYYAKLIKTAE